MARVIIGYTVPVQVVVDLETREVHRVVVVDEAVTYDTEGYTENYDDFSTPSPEQVEQARKIAEEEAMWPAWEFGW